MTDKTGKSKSYLINLVGILVIAVGVLISFVVFYRSNETRIQRQNENYLADLASQRAALIDDLFDENLRYIESAAIVLETAFQNRDVQTERLNVEQEADMDADEIRKVAEILKLYEQRFAFDYLRFIDLYGRDYTTGEKVIAAIVSEREYYQEGVQGKTGMTYILDSKVTQERQIGFFSPVYQNGRIAGVVVGFYGEEFINELLDISLFDNDCEALLCDGEGTVIYSSAADEPSGNFLTDLYELSFSDDVDRQRVAEAFASDVDTLYSYQMRGVQTVGYVAYIGDESDFFLVLNFPADTYQGMIRNAGNNGVVLLLSLIAIFLAAAVFYIVRFLLQKKRLLEETKNSNAIHFAMSRLFENFVLVNARSRTYHYIEGMPDVGHIPNDGSYDLFAEDLLKRFPNEEERLEAEKLISFDRLLEEMNGGANILSFKLHAPIRDEEWFAYNFIVVAREQDGSVSEFIIARQDISRLQEKEEENRRILERARDEAEKGNRAKSEFLSSMSHDIRTPMNAIIGYTNIALDHIDETAMVRDSLSKISSSSHYLLSLINDVLDMSKIESGKIQLKASRCDLRRLFEGIADLTRSQANKKQLQISYDVEGLRHPLVMVDELRLEQVLINIASNAVKYTPNGGSIFISAREEDTDVENTGRYRFTIRDTGIGMSEDFLPHIFESFSRETNSTINKIQGTGLGMAITSRLVKLMGGSISVQSRPGEGSVFTVELTLPVLEQEDEPAARIEAPTTEVSLEGSRVLLVEDNDINAEIATLVLSGYGVNVERACNGQEGAELLQSRGDDYFDAVLMDIQMPVMNGYEATRLIRSRSGEYAKHVPILAMSANAYEEDIREALDSGMNGHLAKPFEPERLAQELQRQIDRRRNS